MEKFKRWFIIGTDLNGCKCRVRQVRVPGHMNHDEALRYIQRQSPVVSEIESDN